DATARAGDRIDYGGGSEDHKFYLWNGGFRNADARFGDTLTRKEVGTRPAIDLYKNADSAVEMNKELEQIYAAVKEGKLDTTGSNGNVFYKILREGSGDLVTINDTLVVRYIGKLLNDTIFDQTKDKPATFPLRRLIRGWQLGMPFCRQGGKIRLIIPSPLGYSIRNLGIITPNSILVFDVEVLEIKKGKG
ncbi:MAG TPA: FKBP-type peptidyl-prolyl cis-trans isomerase, partial [Ferruginibacter sp.]|nr:FKBP-type peptidyl-prolyl cis-trans isomerase [Ferruginibacter sp.]HNL66621.1 FKBP-type peptidyl-prolyl cis-trans isomerase [Ferruginibacter sp.]